LSTTITVRARGSAAPDDVWVRYVTPRHWAGWSPQISAVSGPPLAERVTAGSTGTVHGPAGVAVSFTVTEVDEAARRWSWRGVGLLDLLMAHGVDPLPSSGAPTATGSTAWARITGPLPIVLGYAPLARHALRRLVSESASDSTSGTVSG
jgi:hypothetical protein